MTKLPATLLFVFLSFILIAQDSLTFEALIKQDSETLLIDGKPIKLQAKKFAFEIVMPAYMLEFNGEEFSSINYIATTSKSHFSKMKQSKCFNCMQRLSPYAYDKHNTGQSMVVGTKGYSFWSVSKFADDNNVSTYSIDSNKIHAEVIIKNLFLEEEGKSVPIRGFKGTIYLIIEAVNRNSTAVGKRTFAEITIE